MKKIVVFVLASVSMLAFSSCDPVVHETFGEIYGVVSDMDTTEPVEGATIVLSPGGTTRMTGSDGRFEYQSLEPQQYTITVQKSGYSTNRKSVTVVVGEKTEANISIRKNN